jgi:hypothetical protein
MSDAAASARTKKELIQLTLEHWFPTHVVPTGGFTAVAQEVGASKPLVTNVARSLGFEAEAPKAATRRAEGCKHCGREVEPGKRTCAECRQVTVACNTCGKLFKRARDRLFERERDPRYHGAMYCSRRCYFNRDIERVWRSAV